MVIIGIDPGKKGGIAVLTTAGKLVSYHRLEGVIDLVNYLRNTATSEKGVCRVYVEKCQAMSKGGVKQGVKGMFNYGMGFGKILGVLSGLGLSHDLVSPRTWQKKMIPGAKIGESKQAAKVKAFQLYPNESFIPTGCRTPHDGVIDAVLIAEYGRLLHV